MTLAYIALPQGQQSKADKNEVCLHFGGRKYVAMVAAFGAAGARLERVAAVMVDPPLADKDITNRDELSGAIAVIQRGGVPFVEKARRAQEAEAVAVIVVNSSDDPYVPLGDGDDITVPVICVNKSDGQEIVAKLPGAASLSFGDAPVKPAGPAEMFGQFFESCILGTKMAMGENDWEEAVLHINRYLQFKQMQEEAMTEDERTVMVRHHFDLHFPSDIACWRLFTSLQPAHFSGRRTDQSHDRSHERS